MIEICDLKTGDSLPLANSFEDTATNPKTKLKWVKCADSDVQKRARLLTRGIGTACAMWPMMLLSQEAFIRHTLDVYGLLGPLAWAVRSDQYCSPLFLLCLTSQVSACGLGMTWHAWMARRTHLDVAETGSKREMHFFLFSPIVKLHFAGGKKFLRVSSISKNFFIFYEPFLSLCGQTE